MPHQCTHCGAIYPDACEELLSGCSGCNSRFFYYIKQEKLDELKEANDKPGIELRTSDEIEGEKVEVEEKIKELDDEDGLREKFKEKIKELDLEKADKEQIEKDIRQISGLDEEPDKPVILDLESVKTISPGKFEIDVLNLFSKKRPLIYKLEEGKYIIDLAASLAIDKEKEE